MIPEFSYLVLAEYYAFCYIGQVLKQFIRFCKCHGCRLLSVLNVSVSRRFLNVLVSSWSRKFELKFYLGMDIT